VAGRSNPGLQYSPLRAASRREAFCGRPLSYPHHVADDR
jgi:hypothetical protein